MKKFIKDIFCILGFHKDITTEIYKTFSNGAIVFKVYCANCGEVFAQRDFGG